jgi:hypothetical protein
MMVPILGGGTLLPETFFLELVFELSPVLGFEPFHQEVLLGPGVGMDGSVAVRVHEVAFDRNDSVFDFDRPHKYIQGFFAVAMSSPTTASSNVHLPESSFNGHLVEKCLLIFHGLGQISKYSPIIANKNQ